MSDYDTLPESEQLLYQGVALCASLTEALRRDCGEDYAEGAMVWAVHRSCPSFKDETTKIPGGVGKFTADGEWFLGAFPSSAVERAGVELENVEGNVCVCIMVGDDESTMMLPVEEMSKTAQELEKKLGFRTDLKVNKVNARGGQA